MTEDLVTLVVDFESFFTQDYSLKKISPAEYILDPRFEAICLGVANLVDPPILIDGPEIPAFIKHLKFQQSLNGRIVMVSHNCQFDMAVMAWRFGFIPDFMVDTIALSRTVLGPLLRSHSLADVAAHFGLPEKGSMTQHVKGMTRADIIACDLWDREVEYCLHDTWLCREIYHRLYRMVPSEELILHDTITRCTTEPMLMVDTDLLAIHLDKVLSEKAAALAQVEQLGVQKGDLMSNPKLAHVLRMLGVEPPMKVSPRTHQPTYAFAKDDQEFIGLLDHPNIVVRTVVEARLETKSTIEETRTKRFLKIAALEFPNGRCRMPMPVIIGAAHTHRFGGGWDLNVQNLGRESELRDALYAPEGHTLLVVDAKQIEARVTAEFCGETDLVEQFRRGEDVYANFATTVFGRPITSANKPERFVGKTGILQLGYASGWLKFQRTVWLQSRNSDTPVVLTDQSAIDTVNAYRGRMRRITATWGELDQILAMMGGLPDLGEGEGLTKKCVTFYKNLMIGPTGLPIHFPDLTYDYEQRGWFFRDGRRTRKTYGASLLETISQHLSRCIVMMASVRLRTPMANLGARLVHSAHDELVYVVPLDQVEPAKIWAELEMNRPPSWMPNLPLACDIGVAQRYGDAK
jgi:DNA polymerase